MTQAVAPMTATQTMIQLNCQTSIPEVTGLNSNEITVGRILISDCQGDVPADFDFSQAKFKLPENEELTFKFLKQEGAQASFRIHWTVYKAGEIKSPDLVLSDGKSELNLGPQEMSVQSVIEKTPEPAKPYGSVFPITMHWPIWYFIIAFILMAFLITAGILQVKKIINRRKIKNRLKTYDSPLPADLQFYKMIRHLEKQNFPLSEVKQAFYLYLTRRYQIPVLEMNEKQALAFLKKENVNKKTIQNLKKYLDDFSHAEDLNPKKKNEFTSSYLPRLYQFVDQTELQQSRQSLDRGAL